MRSVEDMARAWLWRKNIPLLQTRSDLVLWRQVRKQVRQWNGHAPQLRYLDTLRPTRATRHKWREIARLAAKREADEKRPAPKSERPLCGARTRDGGTCHAKVCPRPDGNGMASKCRLHGGLSTGAKTEGRAAIARSNRTRQAPTKYSAEVGAKIVQGIARGVSVKRACQAAGVSVQTFYNWQEKHEEFAAAVAGTWRERSQGRDIYQVLGIPASLAKRLERMNSLDAD